MLYCSISWENADEITQNLFSSASIGQFAKPDVGGNLPYNRPTVGLPKTVGGGAFDAPAVTDLSIFHLSANTQELPPDADFFASFFADHKKEDSPLVGLHSPKKPDKIEKGAVCLMRQPLFQRMREFESHILNLVNKKRPPEWVIFFIGRG